MRRIVGVLAVAAVVVVIVLLVSGGGGGNDEKQVRATLAQYAQAAARKDYATICTRLLAPHLLDQLRQIKLPCKSAFARGLGSVQSPSLTVKHVKITGTIALADVDTGAANQKPLAGTFELIKLGGLWRIQSEAEPTTKTPTTVP